mgnify:CR=1 FL=1|tara:strand:+ start:2526 stop:3353 length:828 start_codon:yes stop_codon:yes gene_type:complete
MELVSIIIPCYNDAQYVEQAIESGLNQTWQNIEVIVIDDGSDQQTKNVLKHIKSPLLRLITQENKGQSAARNRGISEAKGEYILVLDSDDYFEPRFCELALKEIKNDLNVKLVSCFAKLHYENGSFKIFQPQGGSLKDFLFSNCAMGSIMFRKEDWKQAGGYDEAMRSGWEDWEFYIRLLASGGNCLVIKKPLFNYRKRGNTTTERANQNKYKLWSYILDKHRVIYKDHYSSLIDFFLTKIEREEKEKIKNSQRVDYILGKELLKPIRFLKKLWK